MYASQLLGWLWARITSKSLKRPTMEGVSNEESSMPNASLKASLRSSHQQSSWTLTRLMSSG